MKREGTIWAVAALWLATVGCGFWLWERYDTTPGLAPAPANASVPDEPSRGRWQLTLFGHPHCPCFRASLRELAEITRAAPEMAARVVFVCPPEAGWQFGEAWDAAARLPAIEVTSDSGADARRSGAATSGMAVLTDPSGRVVFRGGLTPARGRTGESAGRRAVLAWVTTGDGAPTAPVFGCPLFDSEE